MSVLLLTIIGVVLLAGPLWLVLGNRFSFSEEEPANSVANLLAYGLGLMPLVFMLVVFGLGDQ